MASMNDILSLSNPVFGSFALYGTLAVCKMLDMALWTSVKRFQHMAFTNKEDVQMGKGMVSSTQAEKMQAKVDDRVERVRRNHLNDLENIPAFLLIGFIYVLTRPDPWLATWHFRVFFISRVIHTFVYQWKVPQPARALSFTAGLAVTTSMAIRILVKTWSFY